MNSEITILVVDDDQAILDVMKLYLKRRGFQVATALSAEQALTLQSQTPFNLVISDIVMPKLDGYYLLDMLKRNYPETRVIMMTGQSDAEMVRAAISRGADEFVSKPIDFEELGEIIEKVAWKYLADSPRAGKPLS